LDKRSQDLTQYALLIVLVFLSLIMLLGDSQGAQGNAFRNVDNRVSGNPLGTAPD